MGTILIVPGTGFGDIALVPAPFLKHPKGIRDIEEWYVSTAIRKDYVLKIFERQCEIAEQNIATLIDLFGDRIDVALITGTDFGTQRGPFISTAAYRELYMPFHKRVNDLIHERTNWKTFIHSCGAVFDLIPDFIEAGFDILNPVQCSAAEMDPGELKKTFGTGHRLLGRRRRHAEDDRLRHARGSVSARCVSGSTSSTRTAGFVFNSIHNIQGNTPTENMLAMFKAIRDSGN